MSRDHRPSLEQRVTRAGESALAAQGWVSAIDVLVAIGWLASSYVQQWRRGQLEFLLRWTQVDEPRVLEAVRLFQAWASRRQLLPSETAYVARTPARPALRFTSSGDPEAERAFRTHWLSPTLSEKERRTVAEEAGRLPELVVIEPLNHDWKCHRCAGTGPFLIMEEPGPACLECAGLARLAFLPAGDAALTRRAKAKSPTHAVVVRFSGTRGRYERQGLLVDPEALREAERELGERGDPTPGE